MLFLDVNICLHALFPDASEEARRTANWLEEALSGAETVGLSEQVLTSMIRIGTNPRLFPRPSDPLAAVGFAETLMSAPAARRVRPGPGLWSRFADLVTATGLRANDVADAFLAAMALEQKATFVTRDRGFRRFPALPVLDPLA